MANYLPAEAVNEILTGIHAGLSLRAIARMAGAAKSVSYLDLLSTSGSLDEDGVWRPQGIGLRRTTAGE